MDILDRLIGHDAWTTRLLLERCRDLSDAQLDQPFDIDHASLRALFQHMIGNMEVWTDLMLERPARRATANDPRNVSIASFIARHDAACAEFAALARQVAGAGRLDDTWLDVLDNPPARKTYGGAIAHVLTHDMHHRAHVLTVMRWLGLTDLPEGDLLGWEGQLESVTTTPHTAR
jgi:uncharacterized damage-inducible protein DinB